MNLFLDIETTGLVPKGADWRADFNKFPYIVEISWKLGKKFKSFIIHQEGRAIPKEATAIHGITSQVANSELASSPKYVIEQLSLDANMASKIIGHNIYFDTSIIKANVARIYGLCSVQLTQIDEGLDKSKRVDTMRIGQKLTKKWPTLSELCGVLGVVNNNPHRAEGDVQAVEECYGKLIKKGLI